MAKKLEKIITRNENFADWYTSIVNNAKLIQYTDIKGMMVFQPNAWAIWEAIKNQIDLEFKKHGVRNLAMPTLIPLSEFQKEKDHIEGFAPELFMVNQIGDKKLDNPYAIRPTSEILFCNYFKNIVNSYNDLPIKNNQWCSVMRAEKTTRPFLRNAEFHWQELHAIFASEHEADEFAKTILDVYTDFVQNYLCIPVIKGLKTPWERFAGAQKTYTIEAMMQDGQALQSATSHYLGQFFAKAYDIKFQGQDNQMHYVHQMSAGLSTRIIGALIMVHADDQGLILPPDIAFNQIAILSIFANKNPQLLTISEQIRNELSDYRLFEDHSDKGVGYKLAQQEIEGTPICILVGVKELANQQVVLVRRDTHEKINVNLVDLESTVKKLLLDIKTNIYQKAKKQLDESIVFVNSIEELKQVIAQNKMAKAFFDGSKEDDEQIKLLTNASTRCIFDETQSGQCFYTNKKTNKLTLFARAY
ncbi:proline--tRNA ligase [Ureaplasma urealyticum]|uniref:proline--tRNA ligase n=1 Tax=Ureaplasma urealyticum TaxID=2130 RepID=UPI000179415C|nr:proline--tRNA ligase [Ureaplasma urealyticum]EEH02287.1 proline--tRNA ligase [Ureaplasma urealyticum serovar 2 str. ATCC 27814]MDU3864855.1 proline--tRNA ligase [Ureaplasma urealyticum]